MHALLTEMREPLLLPEILDSLTKLDKYSFTFRNRFVYVLFPFYDPAHNDRSTHAIVSLNGRFVKRYVYFYLTRTVPVFMLRKVNVSFLTLFLTLYCLSKLIILLNHDAFLISLLFRIVSSLNHFQLPLFMLSKVNDTF